MSSRPGLPSCDVAIIPRLITWIWSAKKRVITKKMGKTKYMEGCLSFPEIHEYVDRADKVVVSALDENGKPFELEADGLLSICIQHELDHIDGVVFINRMSRLKAKMVQKKMQKRALLHAENTYA